MITLDSQRGCVVLSLRGTLTMQDLVTDLILDPVHLDSWLPAAFTKVGSGLHQCPACATPVSWSYLTQVV